MRIVNTETWIQTLVEEAEQNGGLDRSTQSLELHIKTLMALRANSDGVVEFDLTEIALTFRVSVRHVEAAFESLVQRGWLYPRGMSIISQFQAAIPDLPVQAEPPPPASLRARRRRSEKTALYRWFDKDGVLIYLGITNNVGTRQGAHMKSSVWNDFAHSSTIEWLTGRDAALAAEKAAILSERPVFNIQYNNTPAAYDRVVAYLTTHDRMDLIEDARKAFLKARAKEAQAVQGDLLDEMDP